MLPEGAIGWDVGGAHLKAAAIDGKGRLRAVVMLACPLWLGLQHLSAALTQAVAHLGSDYRRHGLTMTGEISDIFADRSEGVRALLEAMRAGLPGSELLVYAGRAGLVAPAVATARPEHVAAANWLAAATVAASKLGSGLLIDIGSTTADIVPFRDGRPDCLGYSDHERLRCDELVYTGCVRTPVAMLVTRVPFAGEWLPVMAETFATLADVHRLTGALPAHADLHPSADQGPKNAEGSARRLARTIGLDAHAAPFAAWQRLAHYISERQLQRLQAACARVLSRGTLAPSAPIVGAGVGRFLAAQLAPRLGHPYVDFETLFEHAGIVDAPRAADCAPAVAVAALVAGACRARVAGASALQPCG